jgi:hypothetical protein
MPQLVQLAENKEIIAIYDDVIAGEAAGPGKPFWRLFASALYIALERMACSTVCETGYGIGWCKDDAIRIWGRQLSRMRDLKPRATLRNAHKM